MGTLLRDIRHAFRALARTPAFTVTAVLTLAIGIGATVTIFGAVRAVLLRPLPFAAPSELIQLMARSNGREYPWFSPPNFVDLRRDNRVFTELGAAADGSVALTSGDGPPEQVTSASVTGSYFIVFGVPPAHGRAIRLEDAVVGAEPVAVLSYPLWQRRFGGDPAIVGRSIELDDERARVIGVMPRGFETALGAELWTPLAFTADDLATQRGAIYIQVVGRLRPTVTLEQAAADVNALMAGLETQYPGSNRDLSAVPVSLRSAIAGKATDPLLILFAMVGLVLVVASGNVAGLMLVRAMGRRRELAVRSALGASSGRIARGLVIESTLLGLLGGGVGTLLAAWATWWLRSLSSLQVPMLDQTTVDGQVVGFASLLSLAVGVTFGLVPAFQGGRGRDLATRLREGLAGGGQAPGRRRTRDTLVVAQLAGSTALLVGALLVTLSFVRLTRVDPGFRTDRALTFELSLPSARYPTAASKARLVGSLVERLRTVPGAERVGGIFGLPLTNFSYTISLHAVDGRTLETAESAALPSLQVRVVTPDALHALGVPIRSGRGITAADRDGTPPVAVLSETAARRIWPGSDPLGHTLTLGTRLGRPERVGGEVVGVAADIRSQGPGAESPPTIYVAYDQWPTSYLGMVMTTAGGPSASVRAVQQVVGDLDPSLPVFGTRTMAERARTVLVQPRFYATLLGLFAGAALLLAVIGVYGVIAETVASRTREIGIRIALGADRRRVVSSVLRQGLALATIGGALGVAGAAAGARYLTSVLFETAPVDRLTYLGSGVLLIIAALAASYVPARRAARVAPTEALRAE